MKQSLKAYILVALAPLIWSTGGVVIRLLSLSPWEILFWRSLFMALAIFFWLALRGRLRGNTKNLVNELLKGLPVTLFICLSMCFYVLSMKKTGIADSLLIQGVAPLFIIVIGRIYLKERISFRTALALTGIITGLCFIIIPSLSNSRLQGNIFGLAKAASFALGAIAVRKLKQVNMVPATGLAAVFSCIIAAMFMPVQIPVPRDMLILIYAGLVQTGAGFIIFVTWSGKLSSAYTGIIVVLEAVLGPLWVWILMGEKPANLTLIGGMIIIAALVYTSLQTRNTALPAAEN